MTDMMGRVSDWSDSLYNIYIEDGEGVRLVRDEIEACKAFLSNRAVALDENVEGYEVVTTFMSIRWGRESPPLVYETLVTGLGLERTWRYPSRKYAQEGHDRIVQMLRSGVDLKEIK